MDNDYENLPGYGWTNGSIPSSMFSATRDGIAAQYGTQRRWMSLNTSWTRIGSGKRKKLCIKVALCQDIEI